MGSGLTTPTALSPTTSAQCRGPHPNWVPRPNASRTSREARAFHKSDLGYTRHSRVAPGKFLGRPTKNGSTSPEEFTLPYSVAALLPSADSTRLACIAVDSDGMHVEVNGRVVGDESYDEVAGLAFSADSRHIAFAARRGRTWKVVFDGKESSGWAAVGQSGPIIAPDCKSCVYSAMRDGEWYVVFGETIQGPYEEIGEGGIAVSPDSTRLAYVIRKNGAWLMTADGQVCPSFRGITKASWTFSPDSKRFAYIATITTGELAVVLDQEPQRRWPKGSNAGMNEEMFFSPDSRRLAS
ncbi:MAG: hypothetical protein EXQ52_04025 [Bryobacterales bacterium]|nr:hypothetical protein [Bryobacterales bacterium]